MGIKSPIDNYKIALLLQYFNSVDSSYSYQEIMMLFGYTFEQIDNLITYLIDEDLILLKEYLKVSDKGKNYLDNYNLLNVDFEIEETTDDIFTEERISFEDIYIPKKFEKKYKK